MVRTMKATGIVRRIDDLGRVVIPKEIRRTLRIREGDPLEIYTDAQGGVIFRKYSPVGELSSMAGKCAEVLFQVAGGPAIVCDGDHVVAAAGISKREVMEGAFPRNWNSISKTGRIIPGPPTASGSFPWKGCLAQRR